MFSQTPVSKPTRARLALALTLAFVLSVAAAPHTASAQPAKKSPARATRRGATAAKPAHKPATRARRVATQQQQPSPADAKPATGDPKDAQGGAEAKTDGVAEGAAEAKAAAEPKPETVEAELSRRRAEIAAAAKPEQRASMQRALADRLVELNMSGEALSELRLMIHEDRYDPAFFFNTGNALARLGDSNAASDAYRKAVSQRKGNYARALNNLGVVLTRQGRWDEAYDALNAALMQENFTYAEASYNLGRLHLLRGATNLAIREWTRTLRLAPGHVEATAALALAYAQDGDEKRGLALLEKFTARAAQIGGSVPREIAYARDEINSGVEREASSGDGAFAPNTAAPVVGATVAKATTRPAAAPAAARPGAPARSFSVDPVSYTMLRSARDAGDEGKYEEAVRRYRGVLSRNGGYLPPANLELGLALINLHRNGEAIAALNPVAERNGARYPVVHYHLARLYEQQNQLELSARHFARAADLYGDAAPQMLLDLSRVREKAGDAGGALSAMESFVTSIGRQGSIPDWATERLNALREKAKGATASPKP
ncbi:MAG TPA: tetratricopeptide repeat protein [Pyrinomonadaceae bacterium]|jgi:tetratricopeptide (TPR) repeat protein|nr:tetratricopeptide repeat protein [Pyrinomonadaceae bacterium]